MVLPSSSGQGVEEGEAVAQCIDKTRQRLPRHRHFFWLSGPQARASLNQVHVARACPRQRVAQGSNWQGSGARHECGWHFNLRCFPCRWIEKLCRCQRSACRPDLQLLDLVGCFWQICQDTIPPRLCKLKEQNAARIHCQGLGPGQPWRRRFLTFCARRNQESA